MRLLESYANVQQFLIPKGENYELVAESLQLVGLDVPQFTSRCLHCRRRK